MFFKMVAGVFAGFILLLGATASSVQAAEGCQPIGEKKVKIEAWISKKFKKDRRAILKEFREINNAKVSMKVFPMGDPNKVIAIGRCVPVDIAQQAIEKALKYSGGIQSLVNQRGIPTHWVAIGTTAFDEYSQRKVSEEQVAKLRDGTLTTQGFQSLYEEYSELSEFSRGFGMKVPNPRIPDEK